MSLLRLPGPERTEQLTLDRRSLRGGLQHAIRQGGKLGLSSRPPLNISDASLAGIKAQGTARQRHLAQVESRTGTAGPSAQHHQAGFGRAQPGMTGNRALRPRFQHLQGRARQQANPFLARSVVKLLLHLRSRTERILVEPEVMRRTKKRMLRSTDDTLVKIASA